MLYSLWSCNKRSDPQPSKRKKIALIGALGAGEEAGGQRLLAHSLTHTRLPLTWMDGSYQPVIRAGRKKKMRLFFFIVSDWDPQNTIKPKVCVEFPPPLSFSPGSFLK